MPVLQAHYEACMEYGLVEDMIDDTLSVRHTWTPSSAKSAQTTGLADSM